MSHKSYSELILLPTFEERFQYLKINGQCSVETFGGHRALNQILYKSPQWQKARSRAIIRDNGCDLGVKDRPIAGKIIIHHINPLTIEQVINFDPAIFDLDNLICSGEYTHKQIHYGDGSSLIPSVVVERKPGDTKDW